MRLCVQNKIFIQNLVKMHFGRWTAADTLCLNFRFSIWELLGFTFTYIFCIEKREKRREKVNKKNTAFTQLSQHTELPYSFPRVNSNPQILIISLPLSEEFYSFLPVCLCLSKTLVNPSWFKKVFSVLGPIMWSADATGWSISWCHLIASCVTQAA